MVNDSLKNTYIEHLLGIRHGYKQKDRGAIQADKELTSEQKRTANIQRNRHIICQE